MKSLPHPFFAMRGRRMRAGLVALALGAASVSGMAYAHDGEAHGPAHHGMGMHGPMDPAKAEKHIQRMIDHLVPDATADQKTKLAAIHKAAFADLKPLHEKHRAGHEQIAKILSQPNIDRNALEQARQSQMQIADQISKRMTQALADSAAVLTPAQRVKAAENMQKRHEHMRGRMHGGWNKDKDGKQ